MRWTVVVAHRKPMVSEGIVAALARYPAIVPVAAVGTAEEAERIGTRADAVALDAELSGAEIVTSRLQRNGVRVVMIADERRESREEEEGARTVSLRAPVAALASALVPGIRNENHSGKLTPRERQVLELVSRGLAAKQIARSLGISPKTVEHHKSRIYNKLKVSNQTAAVSVALSSSNGGGESWNLSIT